MLNHEPYLWGYFYRMPDGRYIDILILHQDKRRPDVYRSVTGREYRKGTPEFPQNNVMLFDYS